jgi:hypothetical protein
MGFTDVFLQVGDQVRIQAPNGRWVAPIVTGTSAFYVPLRIAESVQSTGTFGSNDFLHSLLGEATDHLVRTLPLHILFLLTPPSINRAKHP